VGQPLSFTYAQLTALPSIERNVLLICPGVFANHGRWKGISLQSILQQANFDRTASRVAFDERGGKSASYPVADVLSSKSFLPTRSMGRRFGSMGSPPGSGRRLLRCQWVKYVSRVRVEKG
jgi:sulfoxide reductase catalytic subunit YedY